MYCSLVSRIGAPSLTLPCFALVDSRSSTTAVAERERAVRSDEEGEGERGRGRERERERRGAGEELTEQTAGTGAAGDQAARCCRAGRNHEDPPQRPETARSASTWRLGQGLCCRRSVMMMFITIYNNNAVGLR